MTSLARYDYTVKKKNPFVEQNRQNQLPAYFYAV